MFGVLTNIESLTEFIDDLLRNLTFVNSEQLNVLSTVKLNLEDTNRLFLLLVVSNILRRLRGTNLALDLVRLRISWASLWLHSVGTISRIATHFSLSWTSVPGGSSLRLRVG